MRKLTLTLALVVAALALSSRVEAGVTLEGATDALELVTSSTSAIDYTCSWSNVTATALTTPGTTKGTITTATTTTVIAAPAASNFRHVRKCWFHNDAGGSSNTLTVQIDVSATNRLLYAATLLAGEALSLTEDGDFILYDSAGLKKSILVTGGGTEATALRVTVANDSTGVLSVDDNGAALTVDAVNLDIRDLTATDVVTVTDGSGALNVIVDSSALPSGAATSALQDGIIKDGAGDTTQANVTTGRLSVDGSGVTQPVSAASLPLPTGASTSALQDGIVKDGTGDTTEANVTTGRLSVDGSGVTQPVSGSVTVTQATATNLNAAVVGTGTAGTPAGNVLTVQGVASMTKLLVTPDSVALPANQSTNVAQFGGTNVSTGTGAGGAGIPRVTISNDSSLAANQSVNVAQVAGTNTVTGGVAGIIAVGGNVANAVAATANPVPVGGIFTTTPATLTTGQTATAQFTAAQNLKHDVTTIAGTAPTTAGKLDVKAADGDVFVRQATATNLNAAVVGTGTAGTPAGNILTVQGVASMTKLLVTPDSVALPANQSVNVAQIAGTNTVTGGVAGIIAVGGNVANAVAATANPVPVGGIFTTTPATLTTGQTATMQFTAAQNQKNDITTIAGTAPTVAGKLDVKAADGDVFVRQATATNLNAAVVGTGTAGSPSGNILTVQGVASMTKLLVTPDSVALPANQSVNEAQRGAVAVVAGACERESLLYIQISQTTGTQLITGTASERIYICALQLMTATAQNVALVDGTGSVCATSPTGLLGGSTAATGWNFAANGGIVLPATRDSWTKTSTDADNVCLLQSGAGQISGSLTYISIPNI